jgi:hypothetical protein
LVRENARAWLSLLDAHRIRPGRPNDSTWSTLEYACHVRDVYRRYLGRIELMLDEDDPLFPNWDQDASAVDDAYEDQDPGQVVTEIVEAGDRLASRLDEIGGVQWDCPDRRSDGAAFTVATIVRYMIHDPVHHIWDVEQQDT